MIDLTTKKVAYVVAGLLGLVLVTPAIVWAHAELKRSEPAAHSRLAALPSEIRLWFSEEPTVSMTHVILKDSAGVAVATGQPAQGETEVAVRIPILGQLRAGSYTVEWRTVAADDGHPSNGTFGFVVLPSAISDGSRPTAPGGSAPRIAPTAATSGGVDAGEMDPLSPAYVIARALTFAALLAIIGAIAFRLSVLSRIPMVPEAVRTDMATGSARLGVWATVVLLVSAGGRLILQSRVVNGSSFDGAAIYTVAVTTRWGHAWHVQVAAAIVALVAFLMARRGPSGAWYVAMLAALVLGITPALGGHAAGAQRLTWLSVGVDGLHVLAASVWMGGLFCVVIVGIPVALRAVDDGRWTTIAAIVVAFSPSALTAATMVAITGTLSACFRLGSVAALWTSGYGQVLLIKLVLVVATAGVGMVNWLRIQPRLGTPEATRSLTHSASIELLLGGLVIAVTAVLVAMPPGGG